MAGFISKVEIGPFCIVIHLSFCSNNHVWSEILQADKFHFRCLVKPKP
jgi:hypothetical protein